MALADWTLVTDGTTTAALDTSHISGEYSLKVHADEGNSTNFVTYFYNSANTTLVNTKIESLMITYTDFLNTASYWTPVAPNVGLTDYTYSSSDKSITKTGGTNGAWSYTCVDSTNYITRSGFGVKVKIKNLTNYTGGFIVGISSVATSFTGAANNTYMRLCLVVQGNSDLGVNGFSVKVWDSQVQRTGTTTGITVADIQTISTSDIFSIEINPTSLKYEFKLNGVLLYSSTLAWSSTYKYIHTSLFNTSDSVYVSVDNPSNTNTYRSSNPILFTRLQGTSLSSSCYALSLSTNGANLSLLKGNLNTATAQILSTSQVFSATANYPYNAVLETTTVDSTAVKCTVSVKTINSLVSTNAPTTHIFYCLASSGAIVTGKLGFGNALSLENTGYYTPGLFGSSFINTRTIEMWISPRDVTKGRILGRYYNSEQSDIFITLKNGFLVAGSVLWQSGSSVLTYVVGTATPIYPNTWYHVVLSYNATSRNATLYINGNSQGSYSWPYGYAPSYAQSTHMLIGLSYDYASGGYTGNYYNGLIDSFQFVNEYAYTQSDVTTRYNAQLTTEPTLYPTYGTCLYNFTDIAYTETKVIEFVDGDSPILGAGRTGVGVYNPAKINSNVFFDNTKVYTG